MIYPARSGRQTEEKQEMNIPSRRKLAAAALVIAGLGAFLVPFLLHGPSTQATPNNGGNPNPGSGSNNNRNPGTSTTPTNPTAPTTPTSPGNTGTCSGNDPVDPAHSQGDGKSGQHGKHKGLAKTLEDSAQHMLDKIAKHNPAFHEHNSTRTDNDVHVNNGHHDSSSGDQDSSCTSDTEVEDD